MGRYQALRELHQPRAEKTMIASPSCDAPCDSSGHATLVTNVFILLTMSLRNCIQYTECITTRDQEWISHSTQNNVNG